MKVSKMSISLDPNLKDHLQTAAEEAGMSVSAWVAKCVERQLRREGLRRLLDEYQAEHGAFTEEERAQARRALGRDQ